MMKKIVIYSIKDINTEWLEIVIGQNFEDQNVKIEDVRINQFESSNSNTAIIKIRYKDKESKTYPTSFFIKFCEQDDRLIVDSEYLFYTKDYKGLKNSPLPKCFDAQFSRESNSYHILLEDLSKTHYSNKDVQPNLQHALNVAKELARLHSYKWTTKQFKSNQEAKILQQISNYIEHISKGLSPILESIKPKFPQEGIDILKGLFDVYPKKLQERVKNSNGMTLVHGDPNPSNILSPNDSNGKTYIIDRQPFKWSLTHWLGVYDIAYLIVTFWSVKQRRNLEKNMIRHYHKSLLKFGVKDYSLENCLEDYRLCIAHGIYTAIEWGTDEKSLTEMEWLWKKQLKRSLAAFADWNCEELLKS